MFCKMIKLRIIWETEFDFDSEKDDLFEILKLVQKQTEEDPMAIIESDSEGDNFTVECIPITEEF